MPTPIFKFWTAPTLQRTMARCECTGITILYCSQLERGMYIRKKKSGCTITGPHLSHLRPLEEAFYCVTHVFLRETLEKPFRPYPLFFSKKKEQKNTSTMSTYSRQMISVTHPKRRFLPHSHERIFPIVAHNRMTASSS